tara:strand:- start:4107 stop:4343 length:237 start_codon:yes stop_codon:yes gene_type:complete
MGKSIEEMQEEILNHRKGLSLEDKLKEVIETNEAIIMNTKSLLDAEIMFKMWGSAQKSKDKIDSLTILTDSLKEIINE